MNKQPIGYIINEGIDIASDAKIVAEESRRVIAEGVLQEANEDNRNGRFYTLQDLSREIKCPRTMELFSKGQMRGELGHPQTKELSRQQVIDPDMVCVKYLKFWMDGNKVMAQFRGTNNDKGEFFDLDLRDGDLPSFSLRALGTINNKGGHAIVENLKAITWDNVIYPSHKGAYTTKIVSESAVLSEDKQLHITTESGILIPIMNEEVINYIKTESANIHTILQNFDTLYESITLSENGRSVQMQDRYGNLMIVNLENYIQDEIMDYCYNRL